MSLRSILGKIYRKYKVRKLPPNVDKSAYIGRNVMIYNKDNIVMGKRTNINAGAVIMNTRAKFIMGDYSGAAIGLTVITGNHMSIVGKFVKEITDKDKDNSPDGKNYDKDVIIEEDVWIASNVTLLCGCHICRGAIVGAGSVVRSHVPPYAIVIGNPAKIIGFVFTPEQIIEHEKALYPSDQRLPLSLLERNYQKYFTNRLSEISKYIKL